MVTNPMEYKHQAYILTLQCAHQLAPNDADQQRIYHLAHRFLLKEATEKRISTDLYNHFISLFST